MGISFTGNKKYHMLDLDINTHLLHVFRLFYSI